MSYTEEPSSGKGNPYCYNSNEIPSIIHTTATSNDADIMALNYTGDAYIDMSVY